jgi:hypothetical protein
MGTILKGAPPRITPQTVSQRHIASCMFCYNSNVLQLARYLTSVR